MAEYYVERQCWAHWPKTLIMCRKTGNGIERRRYAPATTATKLVHGDGIVGHCDCSACGATIDFYDSYCRRCGARFKEAHL